MAIWEKMRKKSGPEMKWPISVLREKLKIGIYEGTITDWEEELKAETDTVTRLIGKNRVKEIIQIAKRLNELDNRRS